MAEKYTASLAEKMVTPEVPTDFRSSWAQYTVLLESRTKRDEIQAKLKEKGIPSMVYYPRGLHQQAAYAKYELPDSLYPNTLEAANRVLSLPMHPYMQETEQQQIIKELLEAL